MQVRNEPLRKQSEAGRTCGRSADGLFAVGGRELLRPEYNRDLLAFRFGQCDRDESSAIGE